jgi:sucrose synthase
MSSSSQAMLQKSDSIAEKMPDALKQSRYHMKRCFASFVGGGKKLMKREHLMNEIEKCIEDSRERSKILEGLFGYILTCTQEAAVVPPFVALAARPNPGFWEYVKVNSGDLTVDEITATDYLKLKESVFDESWSKDENALEIDFGAIDFTSPRLSLSSSIGKGADYISKFISSKLGGKSDKLEPLLNYLLRLNHHGENLMINDDLNTVAKLQKSLMLAVIVVSTYSKHTPYETFAQR